ncbi:MAG: alpha/beta fold hydrolase [Burkholderiales bacterium]
MNVQRFKSGELQLAYRLVNSSANGDSPHFSRLRRRRGALAGSVPVVFIHGLLSFSYDWVPVAAALGREAACLDLRGFGDSEWSGDYSVPAMAADLGALLDHLGWKKALLVGHALGAQSAAYYASRHPRRVAALALIDYAPEYAAEGAKRAAQIVAAVPDVFASVDAAMAHFKAPREARVRFAAYLLKVEGGYAVKRDPWFRDEARRLLAAGAPPKPRVDLWKGLARLGMPTLVVRGTRSELFAAQTVAKVKAANPLIRVVEVDAGHNVAGENITALVAALRAFG